MAGSLNKDVSFSLASCGKQLVLKNLISKRACDFSWSGWQCFILQFVLWSGMGRGAEMDLIAYAFRIDEIHHPFYEWKLLWHSVFLRFLLSFGNTGTYCSLSEPFLGCAAPPTVNETMEDQDRGGTIHWSGLIRWAFILNWAWVYLISKQCKHPSARQKDR